MGRLGPAVHPAESVPRQRVRAGFGVVCLAVALGLLTGVAVADEPIHHAEAPPAKAGTARPAPAANAAVPARNSRPAWNELTKDERRALQPLQADWARMSEPHKRKWIELSRNYPQMAPADQQRLHARMTDWAKLSPQQRAQARLNFAQASELTPEERQERWKAYQALTPEQRNQLRSSAQAKPPGAATPVRPVPSERLAKVPPADGSGSRRPAKIAAAPPSGAASHGPTSSH